MKPDPQAETGQQRRSERIALCAAGLFLERGADNVRMTDIAAASGVGVASLYRYFGTKSAVMLASGTLLWKDVGTLFEPVFSSREYREANGLGQTAMLLSSYVELYDEHKPFLRFLDDLDGVILAERPDAEALLPYRQSILNFYGLFREAFGRGIADGSIRKDIDPDFAYRTVTDLLNGASRKFIRGEVLPEDDCSKGKEELKLFVRMTLGYFRGPKDRKPKNGKKHKKQ